MEVILGIFLNAIWNVNCALLFPVSRKRTVNAPDRVVFTGIDEEVSPKLTAGAGLSEQ